MLRRACRLPILCELLEHGEFAFVEIVFEEGQSE